MKHCRTLTAILLRFDGLRKALVGEFTIHNEMSETKTMNPSSEAVALPSCNTILVLVPSDKGGFSGDGKIHTVSRYWYGTLLESTVVL